MSLLCSSVHPCSPSPIDVDARALCKAARSLKRLKLEVDISCTSDALAEVFEHRLLEELELALFGAVEVSSPCSPGWGK